MLESSARNFGLLIAYIIPGFVALLGLSVVYEPIRLWLLGAGESGPNIGGVIYLLLGCVGTGMTASAVRWAVLDAIHQRCGVVRPDWNDERLMERLEAYQLLIEIHYRYYQFYANNLVAILFSFGIKCVHDGITNGWLDAGVALIVAIFFAASRDALTRYYRRTSLLLGIQKGAGEHMTNGGHHDSGGSTNKPQDSKNAPSPKTPTPTKAVPAPPQSPVKP